jgi:hypothetical protein
MEHTPFKHACDRKRRKGYKHLSIQRRPTLNMVLHQLPHAQLNQPQRNFTTPHSPSHITKAKMSIPNGWPTAPGDTSSNEPSNLPKQVSFCHTVDYSRARSHQSPARTLIRSPTSRTTPPPDHPQKGITTNTCRPRHAYPASTAYGTSGSNRGRP